MVKIGDKVVITSRLYGHRFDIGEEVTITSLGHFIDYTAVNDEGDEWWVDNEEITINNQSNMKLMKQAVMDTATRLCKANNTVTTLELKVELRKTHPYFHWIQNSRNGLIGVSEYMQELCDEGNFTYIDNGTYRIYSMVVKTAVKKTRAKVSNVTTAVTATPKVKNPMHNVRSISRQKAYDMMVSNKGHFFTAEFIKQDGTNRTINCQYMKDQNPVLGYIRVKEAGKMKTGDNPIRQINLQTLKSLRIGGQTYKVK